MPYKRIKTDIITTTELRSNTQGLSYSILPKKDKKREKKPKTTKQPRSKLMQGATAVLGLGVMAVTHGTGNSSLQSQALTQVKNEFMPEKTEAF